MNKEAQRIAIAEWAGYKWPGSRKDKDIIGWQLNGQYIPRLPDYLNDLNACHEAVKMLTPEQKAQYHIYLAKDFCGARGYEWDEGFADAIDATAPQRCEAFLRTIGKWKENE